MDWRSLFEHVIDCPVRRATGSTPAARPLASGTYPYARFLYSCLMKESCAGSSSSGKSSSVIGPSVGRRLPPGSGQHRCVCGLSYTQAFNLLRHQRTKGCVKVANGTATSSQSAVSVAQKETWTAGGSNSPFICPYAECGKEILYERNYRSHLQYHEERLLKLSLPRSQHRDATASTAVTEPSDLTSDMGPVPSPLPQTYAPDVQMEIELS